jgi:hypothetical protein
VWRFLVGVLSGYTVLALEYNRVRSRVGSLVESLQAVSHDLDIKLRVV